MDRIRARQELTHGDVDRMLKTVAEDQRADVEALRQHVGKPIGGGGNDVYDALAAYTQLVAKANPQIVTNPPPLLVENLPVSVDAQMRSLSRQLGDRLAQGTNGKDALTNLINTSTPKSLVDDAGVDNPHPGEQLAASDFPVPLSHSQEDIEKLLTIDREKVPEESDMREIRRQALQQLSSQDIKKARSFKSQRENVIELRRLNREQAVDNWDRGVQKIKAIDDQVAEFLQDHNIDDIALNDREFFEAQLYALTHHQHDRGDREVTPKRLNRYADAVRAQLDDEHELSEVTSAHQKIENSLQGVVAAARNDPKDLAGFAESIVAAASSAIQIPQLDRVHGKAMESGDTQPGTEDQQAVMRRFSRQAVADLSAEEAAALFANLTAKDGAGSVMLELLNKYADQLPGDAAVNNLAGSKLGDMTEAFMTALAEKADIKTGAMDIDDLKQNGNNNEDALVAAYPTFKDTVQDMISALPKSAIRAAGSFDSRISVSVLSSVVDPAETRN